MKVGIRKGVTTQNRTKMLEGRLNGKWLASRRKGRGDGFQAADAAGASSTLAASSGAFSSTSLRSEVQRLST